MTKALKKDATYADLYGVPDNFIAEILGGELYASPRPAYPHAFAASALGSQIGGPFQFGVNGPGGWLVLYEPELQMERTLEIYRLESAGWLVLATHEAAARVRAEPFDAVELDLCTLWPG